MKHRVRAQEAGFTLVEIMVVVVILGLLATMVVPNLVNAGEEARLKKALTDCNQIHSAATQYVVKNGRIPTVEDLTAPDDTGNPYIEGGEPPQDPWNHPYIIRKLEGRLRFEVLSSGPDEQEDSEDDIVYPKRAAN